MNVKQLGLGIVLVDFAALVGYAVYQYGYVGCFEAMTANAATLAFLADLVIALGLVSIWMLQDARARRQRVRSVATSPRPWCGRYAAVASGRDSGRQSGRSRACLGWLST